MLDQRSHDVVCFQEHKLPPAVQDEKVSQQKKKAWRLHLASSVLKEAGRSAGVGIAVAATINSGRPLPRLGRAAVRPFQGGQARHASAGRPHSG